MKIISWNICGIGTRNEKGLLDKLLDEDPDILCLQEIKKQEIPEKEGYIAYKNSSEVLSNYGTAIYTKIEPISVKMGFKGTKFADKELDREGRVIRMEFEHFYLYNIYAPTGSGSDEEFERKTRFYDKLTKYVSESNKPSIICGDFNRISKEIDAKNITDSIKKSGFAPIEQEWFGEILVKYVDAFREFNQEGGNYTWFWSDDYFEENNGFRFDYFLVSNSYKKTITDSYILTDDFGSDHAPIVLELNSCPSCGTVNNLSNELCFYCGGKLKKEDEEEIFCEEKLEIPKDKIILLDLNYTLISNSDEIWDYPLDKKIKSQQYEIDLINLIKENYVILITASPYERSYNILRDIKEKTGFEPDESYWNFHRFNRQAPKLKEYWMENEILPMHGDNPDQYLAIESNPKTRDMYDELGIEAKPKQYFI